MSVDEAYHIHNQTETFDSNGDDGECYRYSELPKMFKVLQDLENHYNQEQIQMAKFLFILLLFVVGLNSFAYSSIFLNLTLFLNMDPLHWDADHASNMMLVCGCITCVFAVVTGWLADNIFKQFNVLIIGYFPCIVGIVLFCIIGYAHDEFLRISIEDIELSNNTLLESICFATNARNSSEFVGDATANCEFFIYWTLLIFSIGAGALSVNTPLFIIHQIRILEVGTRQFFNWVLFSQVGGSLFCALGVCYVQQNVSFFYGFLMGLSAILMSLLVVLLGYRFYESPEPKRKYTYSVLKVLRYAMSRSARKTRNQIRKQGLNVSLLDVAKERFFGPYENDLVDEVKILLQLVPVILCFTFYWVLYYQTSSSFVTQGLHMRLIDLNEYENSTTGESLGQQKFVLPAVWLNMFAYIPVLLLIVLAELLLIPVFGRLRWVPRMATDTRILIGFLLSSLAFASAGFVEHRRIKEFGECKAQHPEENCADVNDDSSYGKFCILDQVIGGTTYHATDFSIFFQMPQYLLMGLGEFFALNGCLEFSYLEAPPNMKGLVMGLFFVSAGLGSLLATVLSGLAQNANWYCHSESYDFCNPNSGELYNYFWLLAGLQLAVSLLYCVLVALYRKFREDRQVSVWIAVCCFFCIN